MNTRASLISPQSAILAAALLVLTIMFFVAIQPEFRGGRFITSVLAIAIGLVSTVLLRAMTSVEVLVRDDSADELPLKLDDRQEIGWTTILLVTALTTGLFLSVAIFGIVVGLIFAVFAILRLRMRVPLHNATLLALVWGVVVPVAFSMILEVPMWPGLIPEIVPRWIGGGLLPPL